MKFNRTRTILLVATCLVVASCGALGVLYYGIVSKKHTIEERAYAWAAAEERREQLASLAILMEDTEEPRVRLGALVLTDETVIDFLSNIEGMARRYGVMMETESLNVEPITGNSTFESLALTIQLTGDLGRISSMVGLIETLPFQTTVRRLQLDRTGVNAGGSSNWRGSLDIRVTKYKTP